MRKLQVFCLGSAALAFSMISASLLSTAAYGRALYGPGPASGFGSLGSDTTGSQGWTVPVRYPASPSPTDSPQRDWSSSSTSWRA